MGDGLIFNKNREIIINFIKENPNATYKLIRTKTKLHPERFFSSLEDAYKEAGIKSPRTFKFKTKDEKRKIIINYIKQHPKAGGQTIKRDTKINLLSVFDTTKDAFKAAGVEYPRILDGRRRIEKIREIVDAIKKNPNITVQELMSQTKTGFYKMFKNFDEAYKKAKIKPINSRKKWAFKRREQVINFIKNNPLATQREINNTCHTHVQLIFERGIFEAYERAGIKFPYERLKHYGVGLEKIRNRAREFEADIARKISGYGNVNRLVKTKRGFADIILERKGKKVIIEIKDYLNKEISISQVEQLNKYLEDCCCTLGILVCRKKPKRDIFLMGKNRIVILEDSELHKIPSITDM